MTSCTFGRGISLGTISLGVSNFTSGNNLVIFGRGLTMGFSGTKSGRGIISVTVYFAQLLMRSGQINRANSTSKSTDRHRL